MFNGITTRLSFRTILLILLLFLLFSPALSLARPVIFFTDITSGPNTGGENNNGCYLSIFGKGFGTTQGSSKVYINNVEVAAYKYWGTSIGRSDIQQISVQPGPNVTSGPIKVVVDGLASNTDHTFTVRPGKIFFIDNVNGNQSTGTVGDITKPFQYLQPLFQSSPDIAPGDIFVVRGGIYANAGPGAVDFLAPLKDADPTPDATPFSIIGYPGETVTVDLDANTKGIGIWLSTSDAAANPTRNGYTIANLKFKGVKDAMIGLGGEGSGATWDNNYVRLINIVIEGGACGNTGMVTITRSNNIKIYGMKIHATSTCTNNQHHLFYFSSHTDNADLGWMELYSETVHQGGGALQARYAGFSPGVDDHTNIAIHDSYFHDLPGVAVVMNSSVGPGLKFYNNIVTRTGYYSGNSAGGIVYFDATGTGEPTMTVEIYNNTFYNQDNGKGSIYVHDAADVKIQNNLFYADNPTEKYFGEVPYNIATHTITNNAYFGGDSNTIYNTWDDINSRIIADPKLIDPANGNFHLHSSSPLIDAGSSDVNSVVNKDYDYNTRPKGSAYDIGAYEYIIPPPPLNPVP